ncbi:MAG: serine--tRNA ligase [Deltaproteobacteria bacterium]|nr:serine--tRNA ligase [Deltaproteobacteria bacterium]
MLDLRSLIENLDESSARLATRGGDFNLEGLADLYRHRRDTVTRRDELRHEQKQVSSGFKKPGVTSEEREAIRTRSRALSEEIGGLEAESRSLDESIEDILLGLPNFPHRSVPVGADESENVVVRVVGDQPAFDFEPRQHWDIGETLGILDFEGASRIAGSRQVVYRDAGARLERALASFMLDLHTQAHGYREVLTPYIVTPDCMQGTGQLPKFRDEAYEATDGFFLIPTAEVPVTNLHRGEVLAADQLPIRYVAYSSCFRREAGSHGKDVRGMTRVHQFQKVEMVKFTTPDTAYEELEQLVDNAEEVLRRLDLPYRVVELCTGDLGFGAAKCYDIEVWLPGQAAYREISSCSCYESFQARRASIRYRPAPGEKPIFVHTLNGSGLAIGRTIIALLENGQRENSTVAIPEVLRPYMGGLESIEP